MYKQQLLKKKKWSKKLIGKKYENQSMHKIHNLYNSTSKIVYTHLQSLHYILPFCLKMPSIFNKV